MEAGTTTSGTSGQGDDSAKTWKIVAIVCALAAIGLGIWAVSTKSNLDDANKKLDKEKQALTGAQTGEQTELAIDERLRSQYRTVRRRLNRERRTDQRLRSDLNRETSQLKAARNQAATAQSNEQRQRAELRVAKEERDVAAACARGVLGATDDFFEAASSKAGAGAAVKRLQALQSQCQAALG